MKTPLYLSTEESARRLGVTAPTVRELVNAGEVVGIRVNRLIRIETASLEAYIERARITPTAAGE